MTKLFNIFKNMSLLIFSQIITCISSFIWTMIIARSLNLADFGILNFAITFTGLINVFCGFGINLYTTKILSKDFTNNHEKLGSIFLLKIILAILTVILSLFCLILIKKDVLTIEVSLIMTLEIILLSFTELLNGIFQAIEKIKYQVYGTFINNGIMLSLISLVFLLNLGLFGVVFAYCISYIFSVMYLFLKIKDFSFNYSINLSFWKNILKKSLPFGIIAIFSTIYFSIDSVMINLMVGNAATAIYSVAYKIMAVFTTIYMAYMYVIFPLMVKLNNNSINLKSGEVFNDMIKFSYEKSIEYLLLLTLPIVLWVSFYSKDIILLLFEPKYVEAVDLLAILIWTIPFLFINGVSINFLNSTDKEMTALKVMGIASLVNIVLNSFMIFYYSYIGAGIITVLSEILIFLMFIFIIRKNQFNFTKEFSVYLAKLFLCSCVLAIVIFSLKFDYLTIVPVIVLVYLISLFLSKTLDDFDKEIIKNVFKSYDIFVYFNM